MSETPGWTKHFGLMGKLLGKDKPVKASAPSASEGKGVDLGFEASAEENKERAVRGLMSEYERLKGEAVGYRDAMKMEQAFLTLDKAEEVLKTAERLSVLPAEAIDKQEIEDILARYPIIEEAEDDEDVIDTDILKAATPEGREIEFNVKEQLKYWGEFYKKTGVDWVKMPEEIRLKPEQIEKMKEMMARGYDKMIIIPKNLVEKPTITKDASGKATGITNPRYEQLHRLMSQGYNETYQDNGYKDDGSFQGSEDKTTGARIILTKDVQNLKDDAEFKATLNKSIEQLEGDELKRYTGLSESEYLIYHREYYERTGKHLDEVDWTWLPGSSRPLSGRVSRAYWSPGNGQLRVDSYARNLPFDLLGCRLAGSFSI